VSVRPRHDERGRDEDGEEEVDLVHAPNDRVVNVAHAPECLVTRANLQVDLQKGSKEMKIQLAT
jgi:hypothetical protein